MSSALDIPDDALILGIESTCDETACAVVAGGRTVLASVVATQIELHERFGGVVPEIASRAHLETVNTVIEQSLAQANLKPEAFAAVAVANRPGLIGSLLIGLMAAKTLAWVWGKPLLGVNHIHAHAYSPALDAEPIEYPAVALVASGGHTSLYYCRCPMELELMGATTDDAAGEAFDKVAAILKLGYPGGPAIDRTARAGNPKAIAFPRALLRGQSLDFSFSGLKTAVLYHVQGVPGAIRPGAQRGLAAQDTATTEGAAESASRPNMAEQGGVEKLSERQIADIAASFQAALVDVLRIKLRRAVRSSDARGIVIGGGVAANSALRQAVEELGKQLHVAVRMPPLKYCVDNAAMTAGLGFHLLRAGQRDGLDLTAIATTRQ